MDIKETIVILFDPETPLEWMQGCCCERVVFVCAMGRRPTQEQYKIIEGTPNGSYNPQGRMIDCRSYGNG